jgi:hypothetical protein
MTEVKFYFKKIENIFTQVVNHTEITRQGEGDDLAAVSVVGESR